ncbi:MAG: DNA/RNA nuclease SfsA, partial [Bacillota bacterium]|nr:DNA/RNA nuclease SfsA [Bacillota bacterium]
MKYGRVQQGVFLDRPNRFIAHVEIDGRPETVHVKNTGRCRELLVPGAVVFLEDSREAGPPVREGRKTRYSLVAVQKGERLINMDAQAPNKAAGEALRDGRLVLPGLEGGLSLLKPETVFGGSRFDFYAEGRAADLSPRRLFLEVKGVTLEEEGMARFPDAPTERGVRHIQELRAAMEQGWGACLLFVIQMR